IVDHLGRLSGAAMATLKGSPCGVVPPVERVLRADAEPRQHEHHPRGWMVDQREHQIAALEAERRPAFEKIRHVGAHCGGNHPKPRFVDAPQAPERTQGCGGITAPSTKPSLPRDSL